jgi:phosphatidylcholine synthase
MNSEASIAASRRNWLFVTRAWCVHLYTSLGLICAFYAFAAILNHNAQRAFIALAVAMVIDATDGTLARAWKVKVWAPTFDGRKLDDITDYMTYAFIPLFFVWEFDMVSRGGLIVLFICIIAAAYGFCNESAKTRDGYFTGFPNFWDLVIFYLFLMKLPPIVNEIVLLVCAALILLPVGFVSYSTRHFRRLTVALSLVYGVLCLVLIITMQNPNPFVLYGSLLVPLYYVLISVYLHFKVRRLEG